MGFKVPLMSAVSQSTAADGYFPLMNCQCTTNFTDEGSAETPFFVDGVLSNLYISMLTNASSGTSTLRLRKNGADGNMNLSFGAGLAGRFFDNTNTDTISNGDVACTFLDRGGGGNVQVSVAGAQYKTNSGVIVNKVGVSGSANFATGTSYYNFIGGIDTVADNSSLQTPRITVAGTIRNIHAYSNANARTNTTTFRIRKNGTNGNCIVSFAALSTGLRIGSTNSDNIAINDNINTERVTASGSGTFTLRHLGFEIHYPEREMNLFSCDIAGLSYNATTARYSLPVGSFIAGGSSTASTLRLYGSGKLSDFYMNVSTNAATVAALFDLRLNNANTAIGISVPSATSGTFSDTTNTVDFVENDFLDYRYLKSTGSGATTVRWYSVKVKFNSLFKPMVTFF